MYPRNAASPEPVAIGPVILIADGTVQTSGVTVRIKPIGVAEADGAGDVAYSTNGIVIYTPTQAETNYTSFILIATKASCIPASLNVVTTASATPGTVLLAPVTHTSAVVPTVTNLTNPSLGTNAPSGWINAAAIAASALNDKGNWNIGKTGYSLETAPPTAVQNAIQVRTELAVELARIDAAISSRLASLGANAPANWINPAAVAPYRMEVTAGATITGGEAATIEHKAVP